MHPDHLRSSGGKLAAFGGKLADGGQKLETAGQNLVSHASSDRSGIGAVVAKAMGEGVQITGKVFGEGGRVVEGAGKRLHTMADLHEEADRSAASALRKHHPGREGNIAPHGGGVRAARPLGRSSGRDRSARSHLGGNPRDHAVDVNGRTLSEDPIDFASGEVILTQTDVELPGVLPLVLSRTHVSSYRVGRSFGPAWASTVDQRLEVDGEGVVFVAADGVLLAYPTPQDEAVLPEEGARWPLRRTVDGYLLDKPEFAEHLRFDVDGTLRSMGDRRGHDIDFVRAADGTLTQIRHSGGYVVGVEAADGLITGLSVEGRPLARFGYDNDRLAEVVNGSGQPLRLHYDADGRLAQWVDRNGMWYRYHYDNTGRCILAEGADGNLTCALDYDRDNRVTSATDSQGHVTLYQFNQARQIVSVIDPLGARTVSEWDRYDRLLSRTDPLGHTTRLEYTENGDVARVTRPDGSQVLAEHNDLRLPAVVVEPDGAVWRREYDDVGNLVTVTDPAGGVTRYTYDDSHHLAAMTDARGAVTSVECDAAGLPIAVTDPLGARTRYERDRLGRVTTVVDPLGGVTRLEWTGDGQLATRVHPDGSIVRWTYDGEGNEIERVDPHGALTRTDYRGFDMPAATIDATGARTEYHYDTEQRLASITNPAGLVWRYEYDAAGHLVGETDFDGRSTRYGRDATGRMASRTNALGQTTTFVRDALGRVVERHAIDGITTFGYDAADRVLWATNTDADLTLTYDSLGNVLTETCNGRTLTSTYDPLGHKTTRTTASGAVSRWRYDAAGQPLALTAAGATLTFGYDPAGREINRRVGALSLSQTWDAAHRLHTQALTVPAPDNRPHLIQRRAYTYRADGAVTNVVDQIGGVRTYELDQLGRAARVIAADVDERYDYDPSGNVGGPTREHVGTLVRAAGLIRYEHDAQGRIIARHSRTLSGQRRTWRYAWNSDDQLVAVSTPDGVTWRYLYDPLGRRIAKLRLTADNHVAERTDFCWDGTTVVEQAHSGGLTTTWDYQPGEHVPLTQTERDATNQRFYAIVTDMLGTPTELVEANGRLAWRQATTLWGEQLAPYAPGAYCPLRFPGQYHDVETGQNYNLHRYYDPTAGSYASDDPLGADGGPNPHAYVPNPMDWSDPLGLTPCPKGRWKARADFSHKGTMSKKYDAHAADFGVTGNRSNATLAQFEQAMKNHMTDPDTKIYRYNYRGQGPAVGFINPTSHKMVMLHTDGKFWSAYQLGDNQFMNIVHKGFLW
ncbi:rhs protein [Kutzneria sp. 744]|nr:rhs protein [Kutzneria sp. 744]